MKFKLTLYSNLTLLTLHIYIYIYIDFKIRIKNTIENNKNKLNNKSLQWVNENQVLGQLKRTDANTPKELLSVPTLTSISRKEYGESESDSNSNSNITGNNNNNDNNDNNNDALPFTSRLWQMRSLVQKGYEALGTVQELNHLLRSSNIVNDPYARSEILYEVDLAIANLAASVGIINNNNDGNGNGNGNQGPPSAVGDNNSNNSSNSNDSNDINDTKLDPAIVAIILQSSKGKKLMSRSFSLLQPQQRWALLPGT
jgi:hypothetical protein